MLGVITYLRQLVRGAVAWRAAAIRFAGGYNMIGENTVTGGYNLIGGDMTMTNRRSGPPAPSPTPFLLQRLFNKTNTHTDTYTYTCMYPCSLLSSCVQCPTAPTRPGCVYIAIYAHAAAARRRGGEASEEVEEAARRREVEEAVRR